MSRQLSHDVCLGLEYLAAGGTEVSVPEHLDGDPAPGHLLFVQVYVSEPTGAEQVDRGEAGDMRCISDAGHHPASNR